MACADSIEVQHPDTFEIWNPRFQNISQLHSPEWQIPGILSSLKMINMSYLQPELLNSRYAGMVEHFDAPRHIQSSYSSPLEPEQWKLETRRMFNTRLAQMQYYTLGIAQGLGHDVPRARNLLREQGVDATGIIVFRNSEWKNLKVRELAMLLSICAMLVMTVRIGNQFLCWWLLGKLYACLCASLSLVVTIARSIWDIDINCLVRKVDEIAGIDRRPGGIQR